MKVKLLIEGGDMKPGPALSQKIGPLGLNMGQIIQDINKETSGFKGMKVPVELNVDPSTKKYGIKVFSPPVSELLKKELNLEKGSGEQLKTTVANASIEDIIKVAKIKQKNMLAKNLKNAVKTVLGTCGSLGVLVENKKAKLIVNKVNKGDYDEEIKNEKTETDSEKRKQLNDYFEQVKEKQELLAKQEEEAEAEAEKSKQAAAEEAAEATKEGEEAKTPASEQETPEKTPEKPAEKKE